MHKSLAHRELTEKKLKTLVRAGRKLWAPTIIWLSKYLMYCVSCNHTVLQFKNYKKKQKTFCIQIWYSIFWFIAIVSYIWWAFFVVVVNIIFIIIIIILFLLLLLFQKLNFIFSNMPEAIAVWITLWNDHTGQTGVIFHSFIPFVSHSSFSLIPLIHPSISYLTPLPLTIVWLFPPSTPSISP